MTIPTPKMLIFDYGGTLAHEPKTDSLRGYEALFKHVTHNPRGITAAEFNAFATPLFHVMWEKRHMGYEHHEWQFMRFTLEYMQLELGISIEEAERVFWDNAAAAIPMPNINKLLSHLQTKNIRTAVISNISYSGIALERRISELLPMHNFEFMLATSEYIIRKPNPMIFELACRKANLTAADCWYCGDSIKADLEGSHSAGLFPVWHDSDVYPSPWRDKETELAPSFPHLHIRNWLEVLELL